MTIQELKEQIKDLPDHFEVQIHTYDNLLYDVEESSIVFAELFNTGSFILEVSKINLVN